MKPYLLTDAFKYALGIVLILGETLNECLKETIVQRNVLAVLWAMERFRGYLEGAQVTLINNCYGD